MTYEITVPAELEKLGDVNAFVVEKLEDIDCSKKAQIQIEVAIEEIFVNIAHYAYNPVIGRATIRLKIEEETQMAYIQFEDEGKPYNPLEKEDPDITLPVEARSVGGLGIFMTKKSMDDVTYSYVDGKNILTITKKIK